MSGVSELINFDEFKLRVCAFLIGGGGHKVAPTYKMSAGVHARGGVICYPSVVVSASLGIEVGVGFPGLNHLFLKRNRMFLFQILTPCIWEIERLPILACIKCFLKICQVCVHTN